MPKERQSIDKAAPHSRLRLRNEEPQWERRVLHQKFALCVGVLALSLTASGSASAHPAPQPYYPGAARPGTAGLPPHEILAIMRSTGLEPLSRPLRFGPVYALRAVNPSSREVKVIVDARSGRILKVHPVLLQRYVLPPSYGRPPGQTANVPDGYGANSRIAAKPPSVEGPPVRGLAAGALPAVPVPVAAPPRPTAQAGPPPLPRPRPKLAAAEFDSGNHRRAASRAATGRAAASRGQGHKRAAKRKRDYGRDRAGRSGAGARRHARVMPTFVLIDTPRACSVCSLSHQGRRVG